MVQVRVLLLSTIGLSILQMRLRMLEMVCPGGVAPSYRALLEMALQNVAPTKSIFAEMALIGTLTRVCETSAAGAGEIAKQQKIWTYDEGDGA